MDHKVRSKRPRGQRRGPSKGVTVGLPLEAQHEETQHIIWTLPESSATSASCISDTSGAAGTDKEESIILFY